MHPTKTIAAVTAVCLLLLAFPARGADARSLPLTATYCDGSSIALFPFSHVTRGDGSTFDCTEVQAAANGDGLRYSFEDGVDADYNDLVVDLWLSGNSSGAPVAHVRFVSRDAAYRHELHLSIAGAARLVFDAATTTPGAQFDIPLPVRSCPDFALNASPPQRTVRAGTVASYTVTVQTLYGFSTAVSLSVSGLPAGASARFQPNPLPVNGEAKLEVLTAPTTPAGTYRLTLSGSAAGFTHSTEVELRVEAPPPPDFSVEIRPTHRAVEAGQVAFYQVRLTSLNGFAAPIDLQPGTAPAGAVISVTPTRLTPDGMAELRVATSTATPAGDYPLTVGAASGAIRHEASARLTVTAAAPRGAIAKAFAPATACPGQEVAFTISVQNTGAADFDAVLVRDELSPWLEYLGDDAAQPVLRSGQRLEWQPGRLAAGGTLQITVRVRVAGAAPAGVIRNVALFRHAGMASGETIASAPAELTVVEPQLQLLKQVSQAAAWPGDTLEYRLQLRNDSAVALNGVDLGDELAAELEFVDQSGPFSFSRQGNRLRWQGTLASQQQAEVRFRARIGIFTPSGARIANQAALQADPLRQVLRSNTVETRVASEPIDSRQVLFGKRCDVPQSQVGRIVRFSLSIENRSASALLAVQVEDLLPQGFAYVPGSGLLDNRPVADPQGGRRLRWELPAIPPGSSLQLRYQTVIGSDAARGRQVNRAWLHARDASGQAIERQAEATVTLSGDGLIFFCGVEGTVFLDRDGDEFYSPADTPLANIEVRLSNGLSALSDERGRYAMENLYPGDYVVAVNRATLPDRYRAAAPVPQVVSLADGLTDSADFAVRFRGDDDVGTAQVSGRVFFDKDGDGAFSSGDPLLREFQARLDGRAQCRGEEGRFRFTHLEPGRHRLEILTAGRSEQREIELRKGDNAIDVALRFSGIKITVRGEQ